VKQTIEVNGVTITVETTAPVATATATVAPVAKATDLQPETTLDGPNSVRTVDAVLRAYMTAALAACNGNYRATSKALDVSENTLRKYTRPA